MLIRWLTIFLDFPARTFGTGVAFWREVTGSELSRPRGPAGEFATLLPPHADACLRVQRVGEPNGGCHLDVHVDTAAGSLAEAAARATALGARLDHREGDLVVAASPGGLRFCLVPWDGESLVPPPVQLGRGCMSRADQLCLDIPPDAFERECSFWASLTGWDLRPGALPEFAYLERPEGLPVRLLLQRRERAAAQDLVSAHIDLACSDPVPLAERHVASGAQILARFPFWLAMADPAGRGYCLTMRDPGTGKLRGRITG